MKEKSRETEITKHLTPYMDSLYNYALCLTNDSQEAKNLLLATYLKAFQHFNRGRNEINTRSWLFGIMNKYYSYDNSEANSFHPFPPNFNIEKTRGLLEQTLVTEDIQETLSSIPGNYRSIIYLSDVEGFSYEDIAEFKAISVKEVRSSLHTARRILGLKLIQHAYNRAENPVVEQHIESRCSRLFRITHPPRPPL